ncbi:DUF1707 domain-containing protein [Actinoplanes sp. NPDC051475]|uniref:DUF1707 SHOCT-like domain-containing protein n=1 Tax=Actinoplanes sp. NPDC051475 TaxID=3157225 RepID=UPI00344C499D
MRAADADRQHVVEQLQSAVDQGRLTLSEYDERLRIAYEARTYADLTVLIEDLPATTLAIDEVPARTTLAPDSAGGLPHALRVLWTIWGTAVAVNFAVWALATTAAGGGIHPWPVWVAGPPGAALLSVTLGVWAIRRR